MSLTETLHASLAGQDILPLLRLIRSEGIGPVTFFKLLKRYGSAQSALDALPLLQSKSGRKYEAYPAAAAEQELDALARFGARIIPYGSAGYPALLHQVYDAPPLLIAKGRMELLQSGRMLAIVGARNASANGRALAGQFARAAGEAGYTVVSGLARGIDTAAHAASIETGTIAVLGGGIDHIYPPENRALYERISEEGLLLSEQPFGMAPHAHSFPGRNRIISGMSRGTLVIEASLKSGSLITARYALEQHREVFAVPGSPLDPRCRGSNALLKDGATLTESMEDILAVLGAERRIQPQLAEPQMAFDIDEFLPAEAAESAEERLVALLGPEPVGIDALAAECHIPAASLHATLTQWELDGRIQRHPGHKISLRYTGN